MNNDRKNDLGDISEEVFVRRAVNPEVGERNEQMADIQVQNSLRASADRRGNPTQNVGYAPRGEKTQKVTRASAPSEKGSSRKNKNVFGDRLKKLKVVFDGRNNGRPHKEHNHFELARRIAVIGFTVVALAALIICTVVGYSYSGDSIRLMSQMTESERSSAKNYQIVYSEADPWGLTAATVLRDLFLEKTGASLRIVTDAESVGRHEIRVGHTNRAGDDYLTSISALGVDGYAIIISQGDNVNVMAFSEVGANAAVKYFVNSYVGAYRAGQMTFANKMNFSFVSRSGEEPGTALRESKITLNFTETGKFRVLVLSDADINPNTISAINAIAETEKPHLVIFAGDVSSGMTTKADLEAYLKTLTAPLEERQIPWAVVFGEQDTDGGLSAEVQMEVYSSFENCVAKSDFVSDGTVSYFLPVYAAGEGDTSSAPVFGVWAMGQTTMLSLSGGGAANDAVLAEQRENGTDYGYVTSSQIAWFTENQRVLDREAGGAMPTIMVCHTPVPEFAVVAENPEQTRLLGNVGESVAASPLNSGLFTALLDAENVLGLYCGHDHLNSFAGKYCGIELGYSASIGYDGYGFGGTFDINNSLRGGRMIELTIKNGTISSTSRMVYAADYGIGLK